MTDNSLRMHRWIAEFIKRHHGDVYDRACREFVASPEFAAIAARTPEPAVISEPTDVRELRERLERAAELTGDWNSWRAGDVYSACMDAAAALERLEKLERERAEWVEAWDMVRDSILNDYGPLEINDVLGTIDYHDPRPATPAPASQGGEE